MYDVNQPSVFRSRTDLFIYKMSIEYNINLPQFDTKSLRDNFSSYNGT